MSEANKIKWSEQAIQDALYDYRSLISLSPFMVTNVNFFMWESDLIYLSNSSYVTEWEVKISRSDFRCDEKKFRHRCLMDGPKQFVGQRWLGNRIGAKQFYYACPEGLIDPGELPDYAGLFYVSQSDKNLWYKWLLRPDLYCRCVKEAPIRDVPKISTEAALKLAVRGGVRKYWLKRRTIPNVQKV